MFLLKETNCSIAAAFFTHKGRILAPTLLHLHGRESDDVSNSSDEGESILIDTASCFQPELEQHLRRYKLRAKVNIRTITANRYFAPATAVAPAALAQIAPPPHEVYCSSPDPRSALLGSHVLTLAGEPTAGDENEETALRSEQWLERLLTLHGIADGIALASRIPLECNLDLLQYISFSKGCYVGQELTARTKYKVRSGVGSASNRSVIS